MVKMSWLRSLPVDEARDFIVNKEVIALCDENAGFSLVIDGLTSFLNCVKNYMGHYFDDVTSLKKQQNLLDALISTKRYGFDCWFEGDYKVIRDEKNVLQIVMSTYQDDLSDLEVNASLLFSLVDEFSFLANRFPEDISTRAFLRYVQYVFHKIRLDFDYSLVSPIIANDKSLSLPSGYYFSPSDLSVIADVMFSSVEEEPIMMSMSGKRKFKTLIADRFVADFPEMEGYFRERNFRESKKYVNRLQSHIWLSARKDYKQTKFIIKVSGVDISDKIQSGNNYKTLIESSPDAVRKINVFFNKNTGKNFSDIKCSLEKIGLPLALMLSEVMYGVNDDPFYFLSKNPLKEKLES